MNDATEKGRGTTGQGRPIGPDLNDLDPGRVPNPSQPNAVILTEKASRQVTHLKAKARERRVAPSRRTVEVGGERRRSELEGGSEGKGRPPAVGRNSSAVAGQLWSSLVLGRNDCNRSVSDCKGVTRRCGGGRGE